MDILFISNGLLEDLIYFRTGGSDILYNYANNIFGFFTISKEKKSAEVDGLINKKKDINTWGMANTIIYLML